MGRWVTTSQGRRLYIPDEGEENPYAKQVDKELSDKERQIAANKAEGESFVLSQRASDLGLQRMQEKYEAKQARKNAEYRASEMIKNNMDYTDIYNTMKSMGLQEIFKKKLDLRGNIGKSYAVIARKVIADAIQKGKL